MSNFFETRERTIRYETFELYHPAVGVHRRVKGQFYDKQFMLESTAPRNAGEVVTFEPAAFETQHPDISEDSVLTMTTQMGNIGSMIKGYLKQIKAYDNLYPNTTATEYIYREFINGVPSKIYLWVSNFNITGDTVAFVASDDNPNAINVAEVYKAQNFPGLRVIS